MTTTWILFVIILNVQIYQEYDASDMKKIGSIVTVMVQVFKLIFDNEIIDNILQVNEEQEKNMKQMKTKMRKTVQDHRMRKHVRFRKQLQNGSKNTVDIVSLLQLKRITDVAAMESKIG